MTIVKSMLVGIGLSLALATAASAQSMTPEVTDGIAKVVPGNASPGYLGDYAAETRATGHRILMKQGSRLKAGNLDMVQNRIGGETAEHAWEGWRRNF